MADENPDYTKSSYWNTVASELGTWAELVEPQAQKLEVAVKFQQNFTFNTTGADALSKLLRSMAERLDYAVDNYASPSEIRDLNRRYKELLGQYETVKAQLHELTAQSIDNLTVDVERMSSPIPLELDGSKNPIEYKRKWWQIFKRHP